MASGIFTVIYPVKNLEQAKANFGAMLGVAPEVDTPYYVQFKAGDQRLSLDPNGHGRGFTGSVAYWMVDDIKARVGELIAAGATEHEAVKDVGNGSLIASVTDADGNIIGLIQPA